MVNNDTDIKNLDINFKNWFDSILIVGGFPFNVNKDFDPTDYDISINVSDEWYPNIEAQIQEVFCKTYWFPMNEAIGDIGLNSIYGAILILRRAEERNLRVYLHCHAGVNRSRIIQAAYYFLRTGEHYDNVYGGYLNPLLAACARGYLPDKDNFEKFLIELDNKIQNHKNLGGTLDACKLISR
jgi:hypothetical protein